MCAKVYISGALTGISDPYPLRKFYEDIGAVCKELGMAPYIPHQHTDPERHPNITPAQVYEMDAKQVSESDLVIAYVGIPPLGVGCELAIAEENKIPVVLVYERGKRVSRLLRGNPVVRYEIAFRDFDEALRRLREILTNEH